MAARGHPMTSPANIVPVNEIFGLDHVSDIKNHRHLVSITGDGLSAIRFLVKHRLLANEQRCTNAGCPEHPMMGLQRCDSALDGWQWRCRGCSSKLSIRKGSFFEGSHLSLSQLIDIIYFWARQSKVSDVESECEISHQTAIDWENFLRDICCLYLSDHPMELGGPGKEVEIDESYFFHRKYHQGAHRDGQWVLGMVERGSPNCMMTPVEDRSAATLLPIIQRHVLPGTRVITDSWQAYNQLANHVTVNHRLFFVDPVDPTIHTNTIEGSWAHCKAKFRAMHGTSDALFGSHLDEFLWRRLFPKKTFGHMLYWIAHYYSV